MEINTGIKARIFVFVNSWRSGKDGKLSRFSYSERLSISAPRFQAALIKERSPKWTYILFSNYLILRSFRNIKIVSSLLKAFLLRHTGTVLPGYFTKCLNPSFNCWVEFENKSISKWKSLIVETMWCLVQYLLLPCISHKILVNNQICWKRKLNLNINPTHPKINFYNSPYCFLYVSYKMTWRICLATGAS